ncbi:MAG TPA: ABC transporter permease [Verrucomicrobiae bacterium]|jgi:ABC-type transport system involved in multi-copper enzyme maturation permease subunit|nr:ABC transporter permease [Verrucomicrobiae bacterium]
MKALLTIVHLTLHEAGRRRILTATLIGAAAFLILYGIGFHFVAKHAANEAGGIVLRQRLMFNFLTLAGLYATHFLTLMTAVLLPVDTLSGDIATGVVQTLASKPVHRSSIVLGKWLAFSMVAVAYFAVVSGGVLLIARGIGHFTPPGLAQGLPLMALDAVVLVSVSIAGGAQLATVTSGILVFGLYGLAFIGGWVEQVGTMTGNVAAQNVGTVASLIMPTEAIWQRAAYFMQPSVMRDLQLSPFSSGALPSTAMVWWAVLYAVLALLSGIQAFRRRAL